MNNAQILKALVAAQDACSQSLQHIDSHYGLSQILKQAHRETTIAIGEFPAEEVNAAIDALGIGSGS
jgi:hypothetical protein